MLQKSLFIFFAVFALLSCTPKYSDATDKSILFLVDVQNDFIDGALANPAAQANVADIAAKVAAFDGDRIYVTRDTHGEDYLETNEGIKLPVPHCLKGSQGWQINELVAAALDAKDCEVVYFDKPTFGSLELATLVKDYVGDGKASIEVCGYCTDICVVSNAILLKTALYDRASITVDSSCCAGITPESHSAALMTMSMCQIDIK